MGWRAGTAMGALAGLLVSGTAGAAGPSEGQAIFEEARRLDEAGDLRAACERYGRALELEPTAVGGRLHLARCLERTGRTSTAIEQYAVAERLALAANQSERAAYARQQREALVRTRVSSTRSAWPWVTAGVGVALGVGAAFAARDLTVTQDEVYAHCDPTACDRRDGFDPEATNARLRRDFGLTVGLGIGSGLALVASVVGFAVDGAPRDRGVTSARVAPMIAPGLAGLRIEGRF